MPLQNRLKMKRPHGGSPLKCRMVALGKLHEEVVRHARSETVSIVIRILKVTPSFEEAQKELGEIGAKSGYKQYKQNIAERDREYEDIKAQLLKIKKEIDGNAVSTTPISTK